MQYEEYYIRTGTNERYGPYDLVTVVKKIRNGVITSYTLIEVGKQAGAKPAHVWPELTEFFLDQHEQANYASAHSHLHDHNFIAILASGWKFLMRTQVATVYSAFYVLSAVLMLAMVHIFIPASLHVAAYMLCFFLAYFLLSFYALSVLRMVRGQPVDIDYVLGKVGPQIKPLLVVSTLISLCMMIGIVLLFISDNMFLAVAGVVIIAVPGLMMITLYGFAPLLVLDQGYDFSEAMEISRKAVLGAGWESVGYIFGLYMINFVAGLVALLPLVITLPLTHAPLTEIYDELFS